MVGWTARVKASPDARLKKTAALGALKEIGASVDEFSGIETKGTSRSVRVDEVSSTSVTGSTGLAESSLERLGKKVRNERLLEKGA